MLPSQILPFQLVGSHDFGKIIRSPQCFARRGVCLMPYAMQFTAHRIGGQVELRPYKVFYLKRGSTVKGVPRVFLPSVNTLQARA